MGSLNTRTLSVFGLVLILVDLSTFLESTNFRAIQLVAIAFKVIPLFVNFPIYGS